MLSVRGRDHMTLQYNVQIFVVQELVCERILEEVQFESERNKPYS
jgi:hypothetical protein